MKPTYLLILFLSISLMGFGMARSATLMGMDGSVASNLEFPFGGMHLFTLGSETCDCGGNSHVILDYATMNVISLYKAPQSVFYSYFNASGLYQLGTYRMPASYNCDMYVYYTCITVYYNDGDYGSMPGTGTTIE